MINKIPYFIVNPNACYGNAIHHWELFKKNLEAESIHYEHSFTERAGDGKRLALEAIDSGFDLIIAFGGDGTLSEILNGIMVAKSTDKILGLVPAGSSNDYIKNFKKDENNFFCKILSNSPVEVDVGKIDFVDENGNRKEKYFLVNSSIGVIANSIAYFNNQSGTNRLCKKISLDLCVIISGIKSIVRSHSINCCVKVNGKIFNEGELSNLSILKTPYFGGGMSYNIQVPMDDGEFKIVGINKLSHAEMMSVLPKFYDGTILNNKEVWMCSGTTVEIESEKNELIEADGEIEGFLPAKYTILPKAITIIF